MRYLADYGRATTSGRSTACDARIGDADVGELSGQALLLAPVDPEWLADPQGSALIATRKGYRIVVISGRAADGGWEVSKRHVAKERPLRIDTEYFRPVVPKRVRARVLECHENTDLRA